MDKDKRKRPPGKPHASAAPTRAFQKPEGKNASPRKSPGSKPPGAKSRPKAPAAAVPEHAEGERIAKVMARAGLCSRRDAEVWITEGRVAVNGQVLTSPALTVLPTDDIKVDGQTMAQPERSRLFLFHKPRGLVTTNKDPEGRATVFDYLEERHPDLPRLVSVGRLDINTEGLLLLTNDGGLARVLELPTTGWLRRYRVRANGETDQAVLDRLADGVTIEGIHYAGIEAALDRVQGANNWMTIGLREGKNREIKRVLEHLGLAVNRLIRISFGPFQLGDLTDGAIEEVRTRVLRDQLGATLAAAAGVDFDGPLAEAPPSVEPQRPPRRSEGRDGGPIKRRGETHGPVPRRAGARPQRAHVAEPEPDKIRTRPKPGPRKHISTMRAEEAQTSQQGRRRTVQSETADRKGRSVTVELRVAADKPRRASSKTSWSPDARPARGEHAGERSGGRPQGERQNGRRTDRGTERQSERATERPARPPRRDGEQAPARRMEAAGGDRQDRRRSTLAEGPERKGRGGPAGPRREALERPSRPRDADNTRREDKPRGAGKPWAGKTRTDAKPARPGGRPQGERFGKPPNKSPGQSPGRPSGKPQGERSGRPPARDAKRAPPRGGAPSGKRPPRGKS